MLFNASRTSDLNAPSLLASSADLRGDVFGGGGASGGEALRIWSATLGGFNEARLDDDILGRTNEKLPTDKWGKGSAYKKVSNEDWRTFGL